MSQTRLKTLNIGKQRLVCVLTDWITTFLAFISFDIFRFFYMGLGDEFSELLAYLFSPKLIFEQISVPILLLFIYWLSGYYNKPLERSRLQEFLITLYSQLFNAVLIYLAALTNDQLYLRRENWMLLLVLFLLLFVFTYSGRIIVTSRMNSRIRRLKIKPKTVIIGRSKEAFRLAKKLSDPATKGSAEIVGFMPFESDCKEERNIKDSNIKLIDDIEGIKNLYKEGMVDQVIVVPDSKKSPSDKILFLLYNLFPLDIAIKIKPDMLSILTPAIRLQDILGEPFIDITSPQISDFSKNVKRTLDVLFASFGLLMLSPLFGILAIGVKLSGKGKIIYSQERVGIHRKPFKIYKFRSMIENAEKNGEPLLSSDNDPRITAVGKWMRKYRLDELPQFWNVIKGDMSLVGPRPERAYFIDRIVEKAPWYTMVLQVRPGITSWGMVKYGYATNIDQMIERNRFDIIYLSNMSVAVDFKILLHTIKTVGTGSGK